MTQSLHGPWRDSLSRQLEVAANDDLMRSLPELARATGIPVPTILRLKRDHPEELPSVGAGTQQYFPAGVIPILRELSFAEEGVPGEAEPHRPLRSLARRRQETQPPSPRPPVPLPEEPVPAKPRRRPRQDAALADRLLALEERQRALISELQELRRELRTSWSAELSQAHLRRTRSPAAVSGPTAAALDAFSSGSVDTP